MSWLEFYNFCLCVLYIVIFGGSVVEVIFEVIEGNDGFLMEVKVFYE